MSDRQKDLLTLFMVALALVLGVTTTLRWLQPAEAHGTLPEIDRTPLEVETLLAPGTVTFDRPPPSTEDLDVLAVFVLNGKVCPPCLSEAADYPPLLADLHAEGLTVRPLALLFEEDAARARRFVGAAELPMPMGWGAAPRLAETLGRTESGPVLQQIVFVDVARDLVFFRSLLPNAVTDHETKRALLRRMVEARTSPPTT